MSRGVERAFKYRFYPNVEQASELARTFGCVRLVYNMALQARTEAWTLRQERVNKTEWHGRNLVVVDRWFPSSKLCSACGAHAERMPLHVRSWTCRCGRVHDRDVNAARNILAEGLSVIACGGGVRPQRESSRTGQSSAKQEPPGATQGIPVP
ncbi:zinc ribbon domain-containing protein [Dactylosporangium sp. NPDC000555]|uniref:helix-turn-helix domain-containing protein n=1 Tax=Dactylosporangium sp. NPDC000555 TaxID=3154260 RepID=UPI0033183BF9